MKQLDKQQLRIAKALIRNPRISDNRLGEEKAISPKTVAKKRLRMEDEGLLRYFAEVDMTATGTGRFQCRHLYILRFKVGVTVKQVLADIDNEPKVVTVFTRSIYESHVAEVDGRVALVMVIDGASDADIVERFQEEIVPLLKQRHGRDAIEEVSTVRLIRQLRVMRNYLLPLNMKGGMLKEDWSDDSIFV